MQVNNPAEAWHALREGNARFVAGQRQHPNQDADRRTEVAAGQKPFAVVFGCADSRVAAEIIFDRGLGDLLVVRIAGHVVDSGVLGSIEFGVTILDVPLVVVLGHDRCGAVTAALTAHATGRMPPGYVRDLVERVMPSLITTGMEMTLAGGLPTDPAILDQVGDEHIRHTCELIVERSSALAERITRGECAMIGLSYHLDEGHARMVHCIGDIGAAPPPAHR